MAISRRSVLLAMSVALLLFASACATDEQAAPTAEPTESPAAEAASTIDVVLQEWAVLPSPELGAAGEVTFEVSNTGSVEHELVVAGSDLDPGDLPTVDNGSVDEDAIDVIGEVEELAPEASEETSLDLEAGTYVLFCNIVEGDEDDPSAVHYQLGMRTAFTVE